MSRTQAALLILAGATFMSFAGLSIRLLNDADGFQILTFRGITQSIIICTVACTIRHIKPIAFLKSFDSTDAYIGLLMACAFCFYIFSILNTSVASTLFILSIAPVFAAFLGWLLINEKPTVVTCASIAIALLGVAIMVGAGVELDRTKGNLFAVVSAFTFACMLVLARKSNKADVLGGNFLAAIIASIAMGTMALTIGRGLQVSTHDLLIILAMGAFSIGLGIALLALAAPKLPAAEVSLLMLLESVASPIWVWLFLGEKMTHLEIVGGALILASVVLLTVARKRSRGVIAIGK